MLPRIVPGTSGRGWYYDPGTATVVVNTGAVDTGQPWRIVVSPTAAVRRPEPAA